MKNGVEANSYSPTKETEIGLLPEDWRVVRLGDYCKLLGGYAFKSGDYIKEGILIVKIGNLQNGSIELNKENSFLQSSKLDTTLNKYKLKGGDILIALTGATTGKTAKVPQKFEGSLLNQRVGKFDIFNNQLYEGFLRFYISTNEFQTGIKNNILQSAQGNVSPKQIENLLIPLPPLPEQKKISAVLNAVQEIKGKTEELIKATKELKKSLMKHLFTYGTVPINEAEKVPLKETEIGLMPEDWEVVSLGEAADKRNETITPSKEGQYKYVGLEHINSGELSLKRYGSDKEVRSAKSHFYVGDILYGKLRPYLDKCVTADFEGICSTDIIVLTPSETMVNQYLANFMHLKPFVKYATKTMTGVNHPRTSWQKLSTYPVPRPPLPLQQKIAEILSEVDEKIDAEEDKKKALEELFKTLLNNLMTGKIRVNDLEIPV